MKMMKRTNAYLCCLALMLGACSHEQGTLSEPSDVNVHLTRAARQQTADLSTSLYALHYLLADADGTILQNQTLDETALQQFGGLSFSLEKGDYKLYLLGEGAEASFAHTTPEVTRPGSTADVWYQTIRFQPVKREVFHAVKDIRVDGKGGDISLDTALDRKNGTVEIACTLPDNSCEVLSMVLLVPDGYLANAMKTDGSLTFVDDTNGTGYFWTYAVRPGTDGIYRVWMLPSLPYTGTIKPRITLTYKQNGNVKNAEIALDGFSVEANKVTKVSADLTHIQV